MTASKAKAKDGGSSCIGLSETVTQAKYNSRQRRNAKPQPWIVLKLIVGFTSGIMCYAFYVYTHKLVVPMLRKEQGALGSQGTGIGLIVVFAILWLWMVWAYVRIVTTSPGKATKFVRPSAPPEPGATSGQQANFYPLDSIGTSAADHQVQTDRPSVSTSHFRDSIGGPSYEDMRASASEAHRPVLSEQDEADIEAIEAGAMNVPPRPSKSPEARLKAPDPVATKSGTSAVPKPFAPIPPMSPSSTTSAVLKRGKMDHRQSLRTHISRIPSTFPLLLPERRYCHRCSIVKAIPCTSLSKLWARIGQCVGARNHKFFINFTSAAAIFTLYTFITLLAFNLIAQNNGTRFSGDWDPQVIVILALSGLFCIFTVSLTGGHVHLILMGQSTVESMNIRDFQERENEKLATAYGLFDVSEKKAKRLEWDKAWGRINREGHIWWQGNTKKEWTDVMGKSPWGWFFPIGKGEADGLSYRVNPRFSEEGVWRPRSEWPEHLR
ncbi:zf-DHHC-domain-containing protein [Flagelloscypha sp. PMI_526]|nr:zf-DHHC-domain-containing protein [Flagelloscypha sp. PMI_526]